MPAMRREGTQAPQVAHGPRVVLDMRPRALTTLLALLLAATAAGPAHGQTDSPATTLAGKGGDAAYYTCINYGGSEESCGAVPASRHPSAKAVAAYESTWVHRALTLQYELAND